MNLGVSVVVCSQQLGVSFRQVWDPEKVIIIPDHYIFTSDPRANRNVDILRCADGGQGCCLGLLAAAAWCRKMGDISNHLADAPACRSVNSGKRWASSFRLSHSIMSHLMVIMAVCRDMSKRYGIKYFYDITDRSNFRANPDYKGVCHVAMAQEGHCLPGALPGTDRVVRA